MQYRTMGRLGWQVSDVGYGMWGIAGGLNGFTGGDFEEAPKCLDAAVALGCNFFDTAWIYGRGVSEKMLGDLVRRHPGRKLVLATKVPPKDRKWPPTPDTALADVFPDDHIREYTHKSLENLGVSKIDLLQFHVWEDRWGHEDSWRRSIEALKTEGVISAFGISVNRWEPTNCFAALDTGLVDTVQVIYNIFDQAPEDELFRRATKDKIGIIARVPLDEGSLGGALTKDTTWLDGDWRNTYFCAENLVPTVERIERLKAVVPKGMILPELALRFVLEHPAVTTVIPGMRKMSHVTSNLNVRRDPLDEELMKELRQHRWERKPTWWSR